MWTSTILLGVVTFLLAYCYRKRKTKQNVFQAMGIPGPDPHWFWGNYQAMYYKTKVIHEQLIEWTQKYGKVYGYYEGPKAILVTSDVDFLQQVFVKQFRSFHGRKLFPASKDPEKVKTGTHMIQARGDSWKRLRTVINPTFSTAKLRQIIPIMNRKIDILVDSLNTAVKSKSATESIEISSYYKALTMDVIGEAAFGLDMKVQEERLTHPLILICKRILSERPQLFYLLILVPEIKDYIVTAARKVMKSPFFDLAKDLDKNIQIRKEQNIRHKDLLQSLIDAEVEDEVSIAQSSKLAMQLDDNGTEKTHQKATEASVNCERKPFNVKKKLSKEEIMLQSTLFLIAGFETTSTTLAYATYQLALNPQVQRRLQQEIDDNVPDEQAMDYEMIQGLTYLDQVIHETLRMYPLGSTVQNRDCMEDCTVNGLPIRKGVTVQADVWSVHYDPELWGPSDPQVFDPDRFSTEQKATRHPLAWIPFGAGPRNCVGLRFGMLEAKLALARVIKNFSFERCEDTEVPLKLIETGTISPLNGITVRIVER